MTTTNTKIHLRKRHLLLFLWGMVLALRPASGQDSGIPANTNSGVPWVNAGSFSGVTSAQIAGSWTGLGNIVNTNTSDFGYVSASAGPGIGGTLSPSGTVSIKDGKTYGTTAYTGYYIGFNIDRAVSGAATTVLASFSYTITTFHSGSATGESVSGSAFSTDIGGYFHKPFDEVRLAVSGGFPYVPSFGNSGAQIQVKNAFLRRYTRTLPCNTRTPLVGPALDATLTSLSVGGWLPGSEANLEDTNPATGASYGAVLGTGTYSVSVKDEAVVYPAGTYGGFRITATSIVGGELINSSTITLRKDGTTVTTQTGAQLLAGSILNSDGTITVGLVSTGEFDEILYSNTGVGLAVGQTVVVQYPVLKGFCDNPIEDQACNTRTYLHEGNGTDKNFPVHVTTNKAAIACLECSIDNPDRVIDNDPANYATISQLAAGASSIYLGVKSEETGGYPAGTFVGFELEDVDVASIGGAITHTISTYMNGTPVDTYTDGGIALGKFFNSTGRNLVGFKATGPFNEVRLTISSLLSTGIYSTRIYNAVIERFCPTYNESCNTPVAITRDAYPLYIDAKNTGINSGASVQNTINNTDRLIDADLSNYATISTLASGTVTASIGVQDGGNTYPAGTFAGFDFSNPSFVGAGFLNNIEISTLGPTGNVIETVDASGSLLSFGSSLLSGTGRQTVGFLAQNEFTGVKLTVKKTVSGELGEIRVYSAVIQKFCDGEALVCGKLTPVATPGYPVYVDGKQTGFFGAVVAGNQINNSQYAIDNDPANYATVLLGATLGASASFAVADAKTTYPAGTYAGFDIGSATLFNAGVLANTQITLFNNGAPVQSGTSTSLLGGVTSSLVTGGYSREVVGIVAHTPFDEVQISFTNGASFNLGEIRIYGAVLQPFLEADGSQACPQQIECQSTYFLTNATDAGKTLSAVVNFDHTGITGVGAAGYKVENPWNAVSPSTTDFARLHNTASAGSEASLSVATPHVVYPAGTVAGFTIKKNPALLAGAAFPSIRITTYLKGQEQETETNNALADFTLLWQWFGTPTDFYNPGFKTTKPFDEVRISVGSLAGIADQYVDVYGAYVDTREATPVPGDGSTPLACTPDLKPTLALNPSTTYGPQTVNVAIRVLELNKVASTGPTHVWLRHIPNITATNLVLNQSYNGWIYKGFSGGYYKFEHPDGLIAEGVSTRINFTVTLDNLNSEGATSLYAVVPVTGVGGETNFDNNSASATWVYYNN